MKKFFLFFLFFFGWKSWCFTQTKDDFVTEILQKIKFEQSTADTSFFPKGIFPVYRQYDANKKSVKADDNIFFQPTKRQPPESLGDRSRSPPRAC